MWVCGWVLGGGGGGIEHSYIVKQVVSASGQWWFNAMFGSYLFLQLPEIVGD